MQRLAAGCKYLGHLYAEEADPDEFMLEALNSFRSFIESIRCNRLEQSANRDFCDYNHSLDNGVALQC